MPTALVSKQFVATFGGPLKAVVEGAGKSVTFMTLPEDEGARLTQADCDRIDCTFIDRDIRFNEFVSADHGNSQPQHNASASNGNERRCAEIFIANFGHWARGEPMFNVQKLAL